MTSFTDEQTQLIASIPMLNSNNVWKERLECMQQNGNPFVTTAIQQIQKLITDSDGISPCVTLSPLVIQVNASLHFRLRCNLIYLL